jgi:uncharacterized membrane protein
MFLRLAAMGGLACRDLNKAMTTYMDTRERRQQMDSTSEVSGMSGLMQTVTTAGAVGAGIIGGVFFTFTAFVMPALRKLPSAQGIEAMQSINKLAVTPPLMLVLFGTAILSVVTAIWAIRHRGQPVSPWLLAGALAYLAAILITMIGNIPLNNSLAVLDPHAAGAPAQWASFVTRWTAWNTARGLTSIAGTVLLIVALIRR